MHLLLAVVIGGLYATGLFMMMRRSIIKWVIGLGLLSHAANLLIFTAAGMKRMSPPLIRDAGEAAPMADPLPQAVILTAIVIAFGIQAFALVLAHRTYETTGVEDLDKLKTTD